MADVSFVQPEDPRIAALMGGQVPDPEAAARAYAATVAMNDVSPTTAGADQVQPPEPPGYTHQTGEDAMTVPGLVRTARDPSNSMPMRLTAAVPMALGQMAGDRLSAASDAVKGPGDAMMGNLDPFSQEGTDRANTLATMLMGGGFVGAEPGAVGIFGSRLAPGVREQVLAMEKAGVGPGKIWHDTGTFRAPGGQLQNEIPDNGAILRIASREKLQNGQALRAGDPDGFLHPELYKPGNYPELANTRITNNVPDGAAGVSRGGEIGIGNYTQQSGTLLHEMQHEVQGLTDAPRGGMPSEFQLSDPALDKISGNLDSLMQAGELLRSRDPQDRMAAYGTLKDTLGTDPRSMDPVDQQKWLDYHLRNYQSQLENAGEGGVVGYNKLAGEVAARNAQTRRDFTPRMRQDKAPWETWDVPRGQQILRYNPKAR